VRYEICVPVIKQIEWAIIHFTHITNSCHELTHITHSLILSQIYPHLYMYINGNEMYFTILIKLLSEIKAYVSSAWDVLIMMCTMFALLLVSERTRAALLAQFLHGVNGLHWWRPLGLYCLLEVSTSVDILQEKDFPVAILIIKSLSLFKGFAI
jgi:hypothetical protein